MTRTMLVGKIHGATVTGTRLDYEGSIAIDEDLLDAARILPHEQVHCWNRTNGARLTTYAIPAPRGSGEVSLNGGAARAAAIGDSMVIAAFVQVSAEAALEHCPAVVLVEDVRNLKWTQSARPRQE